MKRIMHGRSLALGLAVAALAACSDTNEPTLISDADLTADVLVMAGDAIADDVSELIANEVFVGLPGASAGFDLFGSPPDGRPRDPQHPPFGTPPGVSVARTRTCYADNVAQTACDDLTTDSIVITMTMNGSHSRQAMGPRGSHEMSRTVHRSRTLTISGLEGTETSRTHNGVGTSADTSHFAASQAGNGAGVARDFGETSVDSVKNVVFNLPRTTNPWPVSGQIVRVAEGTATFTRGDQTETRTFSRRTVVTFPADAQGNVAIEVNGQQCTLNLITKVIANCQ